MILWVLLHGLACWVLFYVRDLPTLNAPKKLTMPKISDLCENCTIYEMQEYIDSIILPSHDYFNLLKKSEKMCTNQGKGGVFFLPLFTAFLIARGVIDYNIDIWLKILLCVILIVGLAILLYFIYYARKWETLRSNIYDETKSCVYSYCYDFRYQGYTCLNKNLQFAQNNSLINDHNRFLLLINKRLENRHYVAKVANIFGWLIFVFAWGNISKYI